MAITKSQIARQLFSLGGGVSDDNLRSLGIGILGAPITSTAPTGILGTGSMVAGNINRPTSGYETKEKKEEIDKAYEQYEKEDLFKDLGIDLDDLRSQQMKDIEGQTAGLGVVSALKQLGLFGDYLIKQGRMKTLNKTIDAGTGITKKTMAAIIAAQEAKALAEAQAAQRARDRARSEAAYRDETGEGSGYSGGFDPSTGNYDDPFSPGDTE